MRDKVSFKILLVEDAKETKDLVCKTLGPSFAVTWVTTLKEASLLLKEKYFQLILLDVGLPDGDGFQFYSMLKNEDHGRGVAVIFLTARDSESDKVMGITMGAEDYISKPFSPAELKARVEMRIKKSAEIKEQGKVIKKEDLEINLAEQRAFFTARGERVDLGLTPLEFKILVLLSSHEEQVFSRDNLLSQIWGENTHQTDRCVDTHVYSLRKKLGDLSAWIQSVYGQGYRFSSQKLHPTDTAKKAA